MKRVDILSGKFIYVQLQDIRHFRVDSTVRLLDSQFKTESDTNEYTYHKVHACSMFLVQRFKRFGKGFQCRTIFGPSFASL